MSHYLHFGVIFNCIASPSAIALEKIDSPCQIANKKR